MLQSKLVIGGIYQHYKGDFYRVIELGFDSETGTELVIYKAELTGKVWVRTLLQFTETINRDGVIRVPRFKYVDMPQFSR